MENLFENLGITNSLLEGLKIQGIETPTEIQERTVPLALEGKDIMGQSETGTGKTLAYLLPIFQRLDSNAREMQALILTPTHELAVQVQRQIELLAKNSQQPVTSALIIGNVNVTRQIEKLREKPHIIVGSAGRILELIKTKKIKAHTVKTIVIDEADRLLDDKNIENVKAIIKSTLKDRQLMAFSATMPEAAVARAKALMKEPELLKTATREAMPTEIEHMYFITEKRDKIEMIRKLVHSIKPEKAIVFINKGDEVEILTSKLQFHGLKAESIHGTALKTDRKKAMEDFRSGKLQLLIASDIAARGLDIKGVTHIFNVDIPEDPKHYLHRAGRTGRAGEKGVAISIATEAEVKLIERYEKAFKIEIHLKDIHGGKIIAVNRKPIKKD